MKHNTQQMWTAKNGKKVESEQYFYVTGRAYPKIVQGSNATKIVTNPVHDRERFYNDPAIKLSEENMDQFNGTEGAPLCVEHNIKDVVGTVHHSWLGDGDNRALKIVAKIDKNSTRGKQIVQDIRAGKLKGLSVGYGTELITNGKTGVTTLDSKRFREISLVAEPFFENCNLSWSVSASAKNPGFKNPNYNSNPEIDFFYCPISMSADVATNPPTTAQATPAPAPAAADPVPAQELLGEVTKLKNQYTEESKVRQELEKKLAEQEKILELVRERERKEALAYAAEQKPKYEKYVEALTASGLALSDEAKKGYEQSFCDPRFKAAAKDLEHQYKTMQEVQMSLKKAKEELEEERKKSKQLEQREIKTAAVVNHSRTAVQQALGKYIFDSRKWTNTASQQRPTLMTTSHVVATKRSRQHSS